MSIEIKGRDKDGFTAVIRKDSRQGAQEHQEDEDDEFQRAVETVLIEFCRKADEVLEHKDTAKEMVIPIDEVQKYRDAIDTARDVLFG